MAKIGYHCSHEQFAPSRLLDLVQRAEKNGFEAAMCSDHFMPWSVRQGQSGFAWSWLGSALQATKLPFGTVNAPGQRYHPAIIAQAAATLAEMFPGRFWLALGSGQALNEHITGERWPTKPERNARLKESVEVIRALWAGEEVNHDHPEEHGLVRVKLAKLYTRPERPPMIVGAAITPETAEWVAGWADALITIAKPREEMEQIVEAFRRGGGRNKPMFLQAQVCYDPDEQEALRQAHDQWRTNIFESPVLATLETPEQFDQASEYIEPDQVRGPIRVSSDFEQHVEWIRGDIDLGFEQLYLHHVGLDQEGFIEAFGRNVLTQIPRG